MRSSGLVTVVTDREGLAAGVGIVSCYHDLQHRARYASDEFFAHISSVISCIDIGSIPDIVDGNIAYEIVHRLWSFRCSVEGRGYSVRSSIDIVQNAKEEGHDPFPLQFYWSNTSILQCKDIGPSRSVRVRIGPFYIDNEFKLAASVVLLEDPITQLMVTTDPDEMAACEEVVNEIGDMVHDVIDNIVDPTEGEDTEDDSNDITIHIPVDRAIPCDNMFRIMHNMANHGDSWVTK